ncbi:MAG: HlyD family type I secretion periplasmic adaptor subunit [Rhodoferax sp.]
MEKMESAALDVVAKPVTEAERRWRPGQIGFWALAGGFTLFMAWAAFAPLDEGVPSAGFVSIDTKRKAVSHMSGGVIKEVLVKEGQMVKEGDLLMRLDDAVARANLEATRQRYLGLRAMQARLLAEQTGLPEPQWHPDLKAAASDPQIAAQMATQAQLLRARRAALQADLQGIAASRQGQQDMIAAYTGMRASREQQLALVRDELAHLRDLVAQGYAPRNKQLDLERTQADLVSSLTELQGNMLRARATIEELNQRAQQRQQEYRKEVESQLADVTREVQSDAEKLVAVRNEFARTELRSPATGQVVGLAFQTPGGVVPPGQRIMDIVPANEQLLLETQVPPHLIDRVHAGQAVDARFAGFAQTPQLVVPATVLSISGDLLTDQRTGAPYFLARVAVTEEGRRKLGRHRLQPGMPVEVVFKGGERSLLAYMLHPLTKRIAASMKEE